jgi:cell wall-associated NlpC family hydrolase
MEFTLEQQRKYMRIPFKTKGHSFSGCDCGGLVWLIYKEELGIELPKWFEMYEGTRIEHSVLLTETVSTMLGENGIEVDIKERKPFDVIGFNICGAPIHVGIAVNDRFFLHIMQGTTRVVQERFDSLPWRKRIAGCFRHETMFEK